MAESSLCSLPDPVVEELFNKLSPVDRCTLATCSKRMASFIDSPHVWRDVTFKQAKDRSKKSKGRIASDFIETLSFSDSFLKVICEHFQNVRIIISFGYIQRETLTMLSDLCRRGVVKRVHIRVDHFVPYRCTCRGSVDDVNSWLCKDCFHHKTSAGPSNPPIANFIEQLEPGTDVALTLPVFFENGQNSFEPVYICLCWAFYYNPETEKFNSHLKKLILPTNRAYIDAHPVALTISWFPNLEEIHVDISRLSDKLLEELSGHGASKRQKPLRRLVIRHVNKGRTRFPQLSSEAWLQLTKSSPSLTVECYVMTDSLPQLDDVLKPEAPLVKLKVTCRSSDQQNLLKLYSLCQSQSSTLQDFHLSISHDEEDLHLSGSVKEALKDMVGACTKLQHLVLGVEICCMTLVELATSGRQWRTFHYNPEAIFCCEDKVICTDDECSEFDCACSGALEHDRIEDATGFPYCAAAVEEVVDFACPLLDASNSYSVQKA